MKLEVGLGSPGMTRLHRAGLAGLYMTLRAFERQHVRIPGLTWHLSPRTVQLQFHDEPQAAAFGRLISESFRVDGEGFFYLPGMELGNQLEKDPKGFRYHVYGALRGSFLQFGPHCKTGKRQTLVFEVDDKPVYVKDFAPLVSYKHQDAAKEFLTSKGQLRKLVSVKGWLYPGGVERHSGWSNTALQEPFELALCLLYAPIGVIYYHLDNKLAPRKARTAVVIPDISDLEEYVDLREDLNGIDIISFTAAGPADAALRFMADAVRFRVQDEFGSLGVTQIPRCTVVCFGIVQWNEKQKTRTYVTKLENPKRVDLRIYNLAKMFFQNKWQLVRERQVNSKTSEPEHFFPTAFVAREIIAANCASGKPWYTGFADVFTSNKEARQYLIYEREGIAKMLVAEGSLHKTERNFVLICQEAWRRRLGQLGARAEKENADFGRLAQKERERLRVAISKSKTADMLRTVILDLWARGGAQELLQEQWDEVILMFEGDRWKKARDLALLALISYMGAADHTSPDISADNKEGGVAS